MAWWLAYEELYGDMDKEYPIMNNFESAEEGQKWVKENGGYAYTPDPDDPKNYPPYVYESPDGGKTVTRRKHGSFEKETLIKPTPNLDTQVHRKYEEDKGIKDLSDYVSSTYKGHYTNEGSNVQTLDLIHSVGDAESFCRSNAIKYLSRYDKKGSAKNDILKAMHYCLLLYYFSGNTQEPDYTNTRYETF